MYCVGIDLGGTNIAVGVVDTQYHILSHVSIPTRAARPAAAIVADMCRATEMALEQAGLTTDQCASIGVGAPGTCKTKEGIVVRSYSLNWENIPLRAMIAEHFPQIPIRLDNDANCAALAEVKAGAAKGCRNVVLITLGTGVGSGIVLDGNVYTGIKGAGTELGHMMLVYGGAQCVCGRRGCWDAYAAATALILQAQDAAKRHPQSLLNRVPDLTGKAIFDAADQGDETAQEVIDRYCEYIAVGLTDVVNALAPEMILIGGGISRQGERLLAPIRKQVTAECFDKRTEAIPVIRPAQLGNEAGIIGAAAL